MKRFCLVYLVVLINFVPMYSQDNLWEWVKAFQTPGNERATALAYDPVEWHVYLSGEWSEPLDGVLPSGVSPSTDFSGTFGGVDGLVIKVNDDGDLLWAFKIGGDGDDLVNDIHVDDLGNLYICGSIANGNASFAGTGSPTAETEFANPGDNKAFLAKYDPSGMLLWVRFAGDLNYSEGKSISSNQDAVFLTGFHRGDISFGVLPPYAAVGGTDMFIIGYSRDGDELWHVSGGSDKDDMGTSILADESAIYLTGSFKGNQLDYKDTSLDVVPVTINTADGQADIFVLKLSMDGAIQWSRVIASALEDQSEGICFNKGGDLIFLTGSIGSEAIFPLYAANPVPHAGQKDAFVCAMNPDDGATAWVSTLTGDAGLNEIAYDISIDVPGNIFITGSFEGNLIDPDGKDASVGQEDIFVASFSNTGDLRWVKTAGSPGPDIGRAIDATNPARLYCAGEYDESISFDLENLPPEAGQNIFLAKLKPGCIDAIGGLLTAADTVIAEGEAITLTLSDYYGDIRWQFSLPGQDMWTQLTTEIKNTIQVFPGGTADYRAYVSSGSCAPDSSNVVRIEVVNASVRFADAGEDVKICYGDSVQLKAGGGDFYKWDPIDSLDFPDIPNPWAKPSQTTLYVVHVTNADGLTDTDTVEVYVHPRPKVDAGPDLDVCFLEPVSLTAVGEGSLEWFPSDLFEDPTRRDQVISLDTTTRIRVVLIDSLGCRDVDRVWVNITYPPQPNAGRNQVLSAEFETGMTATLEPGEEGTWVVESGNGVFDDIHRPDSRVSELEVGENIFRWMVSNGLCPEASDLVLIEVKDFIIPSVITPNGDGKNDYFHIKGIERYRGSELVVLNRWGEEVYRASPYPNIWNGEDQNGKELPEDTYYIVLKFNEEKIVKGNVLIIR
jgi:gliding motility-associated-like protein